MKTIIKKMSYLVLCVLLTSGCTTASPSRLGPDVTPALYSIETPYTISKVRSANRKSGSYIVGSSYEGTLFAVDYDGKVLWENKLSGFMNHDVWTQDITGDGNDEILTANADGHVYCLSDKGKLKWSFKINDAPMYSVTAIKKDNTSYVVAGGFDNNFYYLDTQGKLIKTIASSTYSIEKSRPNKATKDNPQARSQPAKRHSINFLRALKQADGSDVLAVLGVVNSMQGSGAIYLFKPLADKPFIADPLKAMRSPIGDIRVVDIDDDANQEVLLGSTKMKNQSIALYDPKTKSETVIPLKTISPIFGKFGYRIAQTELVEYQGEKSIFILYGNSLTIIPATMKKVKTKTNVVTGKYSYNDMWKDPATNKIILASSQSGGSSIHVLDIAKKGWDNQFKNLNPPGKIAAILNNIDKVNQQLTHYQETTYKHKPLPVYLMSDINKTSKKVVKHITNEYDSPIFLDSGNLGTENWDRSAIPNKVYQNKRDRRKKYDLSQAEILEKAKQLYSGDVGAAYWGGHGNDPYYRSLDTHIKTLKVANGKKSVLIFPEVAHYDKDFEIMLEDFMFPLAEAAQKLNGNLFLRNKHTFWQSMVYKKGWSRLISGEFADVFVPAMEETTDKSMELSIAGRVGLWASGSVNNWGARLARDNTSYDRLRQNSHQMLPNHALRQYIYSAANGATYINNFPVDQTHMKTFWDLIGKGALYIPKPNEILSYSPVNIGMLPPDNHYLDEGNNVKTTSLYDQKVEDENPMVFSRLNGSWPGAPVTEWDFSRYAAGVKERRLGFLPQYPNGLVLITPPQKGVFADDKAARGALVDHLHPIYKNIMQEYLTDGREYVSADGKQRFPAKEFYKTVEKSIKDKSKLLPITVKGNVAWVVAQTSPTNLRLTLVDGGYINPQTALAEVTFNTISPKKIKDILSGDEFKITNGKINVQLPTGGFRFLDITLEKRL
ncbi:PQQ-binding-like beta-propeller repeat protein [Pseudoalteromonas sp. SWXJZ10B]|uniref:PQQ-binding-like beta-propeller repeat protein n=1 Tax=Pseudoalteromonas sp. SWXJZ10B TaxID=2792063 RepID=UPI0018CF4C20|nr:PQQ-binding-like beta-propeller repeat protein [Pseudoalteromonas sp. SWXJZ10B]MBH0044469.1 PQQ-like beta-propeller repeat protein [Pseudoalteromonas sp. SWXJZ10B]